MARLSIGLHLGEYVQVGEAQVHFVRRCDGAKVRLVIDAPRQVKVVRSRVIERAALADQQANQGVPQGPARS